ncbi:ribbon-helix-helix domain-containing protein [Spongorhabdus nitratireducens]
MTGSLSTQAPRPTTVLGFRTTESLINRLDILARKDNRTRSQMARLLLEQALLQHEQPEEHRSTTDNSQ